MINAAVRHQDEIKLNTTPIIDAVRGTAAVLVKGEKDGQKKTKEAKHI
jgi:hypothetical protein